MREIFSSRGIECIDALSVKLGVLVRGGIRVVYERSTTETQSARRTHREKKTKIWVGLTCMLSFMWKLLKSQNFIIFF